MKNEQVSIKQNPEFYPTYSESGRIVIPKSLMQKFEWLRDGRMCFVYRKIEEHEGKYFPVESFIVRPTRKQAEDDLKAMGIEYCKEHIYQTDFSYKASEEKSLYFYTPFNLKRDFSNLAKKDTRRHLSLKPLNDGEGGLEFLSYFKQ